jgi:hypothetical protein
MGDLVFTFVNTILGGLFTFLNGLFGWLGDLFGALNLYVN